MNKGYQAKDIPTLDAMTVLLASQYPRWKDIADAFYKLPVKVCLAKYNQLLKSGLIDGCGCGCCTVATITSRGRELIARSLSTPCQPPRPDGAHDAERPTPAPAHNGRQG